ncbi:hypothetical protein [Mogibacterium timidum]|uniref:Uncharacterized protein n=1 Tax=Mogibacterium timidum ATCC 33093 TaxID=1401079 RepID=X8ITE8_9FIRM|nr:hypothetical protein [Mogibacterium timidum]EUC53035.1 hypothetical protein HMPREF0581_0978 [Mogibacterium timidum ATCC 33093]
MKGIDVIYMKQELKLTSGYGITRLKQGFTYHMSRLGWKGIIWTSV